MTADIGPWEAIEALRARADDRSDDDRLPEPVPRADSPPPDPIVIALALPEPEGWTDPLTGTEGPRFWERIVANEEARRRRYGRVVTVALVEFDGFVGDGSELARERSLQQFARVARVLAKEARTSDYIARIGPGRFGIILVETDEISAINFIDRARQACWDTLGPGIDLEIRVGWASAAEAGSLQDGILFAESRLSDAAFQDAL